ncbi:diaminobutyrate acetyltransferase [Paenibacillus hexagrammi]|uniref:L-2,4-diaminobutyric acid acetyltransferase n=1 Tax=Paenibacillus hexagrammi TaxID=2908839 RepID=A0ABY3SEL4_9BACL|nr:diaminobutyrate acetyltransferase [Paenibacillus sp. YPD9-1]UJF32351.1 diaminobutyrate acetyltransferase [Paenibacillus sp. YPD9-1]
MKQVQTESCLIRKARALDGKAVWKLVADSGKLDVNSAYCYIMLCEFFSETCYIAEIDGKPAGFVSSYVLPDHPDMLFVWQIVVAREYQGRGIAASLLQELVSSEACRQVRYVQATISPSNTASQTLFRRLASDLQAKLEIKEGFPATLFPGDAHEDEDLIQIGPFNKK